MEVSEPSITSIGNCEDSQMIHMLEKQSVLFRETRQKALDPLKTPGFHSIFGH